MRTIAHARLLTLLRYDRETGLFSWAESRNRSMLGQIAGTIDVTGYRLIKVDGHIFRACRLAWFFEHGQWPVGVIDHRDGNKANDALKNLRDVSHLVNSHNRNRPNKNSSTGYLGVVKDSRSDKWLARLTAKGKQRHLGVFDTPEKARDAYLAAKAAIPELGASPHKA